MTAPLILLDCDGVLADFVGAALDVAHDLTARRWVHADITEWDLFELLVCPKKGPLKEAVRSAVSKKGFCAQIPVLPGADAGVRLLRDAGFRLKVVTSPWRSATWCSERFEWLDRHFGFSMADVIFAKDKSVIAGDVLVDDSSVNLIDWHQARLPCERRRPILWHAPHNANTRTGILHTASWGDVLRTACGVL